MEINENAVTAMRGLIEEGNSARLVEDGGIPYLIRNDEHRIENMESLLPHPTRKRGNPQFTRCESFIRYVNDHKDNSSAIYATQRQLIAVLNHHEPKSKQPDWGDHRATYNMLESAQWKLWTGNNGKHFGQKEFGQLIEDNLTDISQPPSAELVEMVRQFEATSSVEYKSFDRGTDGNYSVSFVQTTVSKAGQKGQVELPRSFVLHIPAFEGGEPQPILAKLRFDISSGRLALWYELQRVQQILDEHVAAVVDLVKGETDIEPFFGTP